MRRKVFEKKNMFGKIGIPERERDTIGSNFSRNRRSAIA